MLKNITVKTKFDEIAEYLMIESEEDLEQYLIQAQARTQNKISSVLKSGVNPGRYDHLCAQNEEGGLLYAGYAFEFNSSIDENIQDFLDYYSTLVNLTYNDLKP